MKNDLQFITASGKEILPYITGLGQLRISVFYDFPYLYEGDLAYEESYLNIYVQNPRSFLFAAFDNDQMVGATTAISLKDETPDIQAPFLKSGIAVDEVCYFGESILLPAYRGRGLGHRFFDEREAYAMQFPGYTTTAFCSVTRQDSHPLYPPGYRSNESFWRKRGYTQQPDMVCQMSWLDRGEKAETLKDLIFWTKKWK